MPRVFNSHTKSKHTVEGEKSIKKQLEFFDNNLYHDNRCIFRIAYGNGVGPTLLRETLLETGMTEFDARIHDESQWNLWWKGYRFKKEELAHLSEYQRVNHHPAPLGRQADIIKKDGLLRAVRRMCATYPKCTSLLPYPSSYHLPREENQFFNTFCQNARAMKKNLGNPKVVIRPNADEELGSESYSSPVAQSQAEYSNIWILKPADQSRGRGIYLFNKLEDLIYQSKSVVQRYITDPLLISGYKFDLRLYAVVPSYAPFIVYICKDGIVRFATDQFDLSNLKNVYSHLTNSSINVNGPGYLVNKAGIGCGCKWTIRQLRQWMHEHNLNDRLLWTRIHILIVLTLLSQASSVPKIPNAYELFGFDILIDSKLRPWLIEVNANPSLAVNCAIDEMVKKPLLMSVMEMIRLHPPPPLNTTQDLVFVIGQDNPNEAQPISHILPPIVSKQTTQLRGCTEKSKQKMTNQALTLEQTSATTGNEVHHCCHSNHINKQTAQFNRNNNPSVASNLTLTIDASSQSTKSTHFRLHQRTINRFKSALSAQTLIGEQLIKSCPLYGTGSEQLLPELLALGKRFSGVINLESRTNQADSKVGKLPPCVNSRSNQTGITVNVRPSGEYLSACSKNENREHVSPVKLPVITGEQKTGRHLIPHAFGSLKLAFPFNLTTRIACARERNAYPDANIIVRAASRLVIRMAQEYMKTSGAAVDWSVMDIPEIWGEKI